MEGEDEKMAAIEEILNTVQLNIKPEVPETSLDSSKLHCILQGTTQNFPGNATTTEYFRVSMLESGHHNKPALFDEQRITTFEELERMSSRVALAIRAFVRDKELRNHNPDQDWVIALCLPPSDRLITCLFAIHKLGAAYLPIDNTFPENRVVSIVADSRPLMVISDDVPSTLSKFTVVNQQTEIFSIEEILQKASKIELNKVIPFSSKVKSLAERVAIVLYTSGSSGTPKGVRLTHRTIMNRLAWQWDTFPYIENESCCFKTALTFVDSVSEIFGPLLRGFGIHIFSRAIVSHPSLLMKNIYSAQITRIVVVPSLLRALISALQLLESDDENDLEREKLDSVRLWVSSGETLHKDLLDDFFGTFRNKPTSLCNFYGSTEIMGDVSYEVFNCAEDIEKQVHGVHVPIGLPIFNTILYVLTDELTVSPEGEIGELFVGGYNVCAGYVGIENSEKFIDNPYSTTLGFNRLFRTGDFVRIGNKHGRRSLIYEGRSDSQIKIRGHRVDLNEVESILERHSDFVARAVVLCHNPGKDDQVIVAFIVPATKNTTLDNISALARTILKPYELPELKLISELPLLVNGKVDRQKLLANYEANRRMNGIGVCSDAWNALNVTPKEMPQARALVEAISEVTQFTANDIIERFDDSFFNLGGSSLNSVCVVTKLRLKHFHISLEDFVEAPTLRQIVPKLTSSAQPVSTGGKHKKYYGEFLGPTNETDAAKIIAHSFSSKGDLEVYTNASYQDFKELVTTLFPFLQKKNLSFIVRRREDKKAVAVALNFDLYDEPSHVPVAPGIKIVLDFLEFVEAPQRDKLPKGRKQILHSFMMGTHESVSDAENVPLISFMEEENTRIGKHKSFHGVMTTNTNPLTMQICSEILGYETLIEYQVNQYVDPDGVRPFRLAPDSQTVVCCWKKLEFGYQDLDFPPKISEPEKTEAVEGQ